jgi:uncharacterized protein (DUF885 family)
MDLIKHVCDCFCITNPWDASKQFGILKDKWYPWYQPFDPDWSLLAQLEQQRVESPYYDTFVTFVKTYNQICNTPMKDCSLNHLIDPFFKIWVLSQEGQVSLDRLNAMLVWLPIQMSRQVQAISKGYSISKRECDLLAKSLQSVPDLTLEFGRKKRELIDWVATVYRPLCRERSGLYGMPNYRALYTQVMRGWTNTNLTPEEVWNIGKNGVLQIYREQDAILKDAGMTREQFLRQVYNSASNSFQSEEECKAYIKQMFELLLAKCKSTFVLPVGFEDPKLHFVENEYEVLGRGTEKPAWFYFNLTKWKFVKKCDLLPFLLHEASPGHAFVLQYKVNAPWWSKIVFLSNTQESIAVFAERLFAENDTLLEKLSRLNFKLWRAIRCVIDVDLHVRGKTPEYCRQLMKKCTFLDDEMIDNEISRYCISPGNATAYYTGLVQLEAAFAKSGKGVYPFFQSLLDNSCFDMATILKRV